MISRRVLLASAVTLICAHWVGATQRPARRRIGYLSIGGETDHAPYYESFRQGIKAHGYIEGENILIETRYSGNRLGALPGLAEELVRLKVELIFSSTTAATRAAKQATSSIPIVFAGVSDPVGSGLVVSFARPGGNITGVMDAGVELTGKRLALLQELLPRMKRVGVLGNPGDTLWEPVWKEAQAAARQLRIEAVPVPITTPDQLDTAFRRQLRSRVDALMVVPQPFCWVHKREIIEFALQAKLPATYEFKGYVVDGGLMTYGPVYPALYVQAARLVDRILKGARPADLPVEQPTHFELVINRRTADAIGLTIPRLLLQRADEVIL